MADFMKIVGITVVVMSLIAYGATVSAEINSASTKEPLMNRTIIARILYSDGEGTYVGSDSVHHYESGVKCWTDYFVVQQGFWYDNWVKASGNLYCTGTSSCQLSHMDGKQTCESWSVSISSGIEAGIVKFGVEAGYQHQTCNTGTDTTSCTWNDKQCHCIWTQQQMTYQNGYMRRRCSSDKGDYTAWMQDWKHDAPTNHVNYGCGSKCTDTYKAHENYLRSY